MESVTELEREALSIAARAPADDPAQSGIDPALAPAPLTGPSEEEILAGYQMICGELIDSGCNALVPAWQVTPREVSKLSTACSKALMLWFPDMIIPPKYLALLTVAGVGFEIAQARKEPSGRYRPARLPENTHGTDIQGRPEPAPAH